MSNAIETELRALINELQGLYRQCVADIAKLNEKVQDNKAWKQNFGEKLIQNSVNKEDFIKLRKKTETIEDKIEVLEDKNDKRNDWIEFLEDKQKSLESDNKLINLVILEILKWTKFEDEDKRIYIKDKLKELESKE